jgi:hypothetical protein
MSTANARLNRTSGRRQLRFWMFSPAVAVAVTALLAGAAKCPTTLSSDEEHEGRAPTSEELRPSVEAAFQREIYAPGSVGTRRCANHVRVTATTIRLS